MPQSDKELILLIGKLDGKVESLISAFEDERDVARADRRATLQKLEDVDRLSTESHDLRVLADQLQKQIYSTKAEVDKTKESVTQYEVATARDIATVTKDLTMVKAVYSKITGIIVVFSVLGTMVLNGITWVISHPTEIYTFIKGIAGGKP